MLTTGFVEDPVAEVAAQKDNGVAKVNQITEKHHS
jgi:hypothetical protein